MMGVKPPSSGGGFKRNHRHPKVRNDVFSLHESKKKEPEKAVADIRAQRLQ
jgi:hypothetical protein